MKKYEAPELFVDTFVADTMIASSNTKNGRPENNQNCWGCNQRAGGTDPNHPENSCFYIPSSDPESQATYIYFCG